MQKKDTFHHLLKWGIVLSSGLGVLLGIANDDWSLNGLAYFTNQSNLLVFLVYGYLALNDKPLSKIVITILYQAVLAIALTGFVYHLILAPTFDGSDGFSFMNFLVHTLTPILVITERIIFSHKHTLHKWHPIYWLSFPLIYFIFTIVFAELGGRFGPGTDYESRYPYVAIALKHLLCKK